MKALATALAILTVSAPGFADESFIENEPTLSEPEQHATTRHAVELSDEQMDGVVAGSRFSSSDFTSSFCICTY